MKKSFRTICALFVVFAMAAMVLAGCSSTSTPSGSTTGTTPPASTFKAAMVTDIGGLGDKSFNDLSWAGLEKAKADLGIETKVLSFTTKDEVKQLRSESLFQSPAGAGQGQIAAPGTAPGGKAQ